MTDIKIITLDELRKTPGSLYVKTALDDFDSRWVKIVKGSLLTTLSRSGKRFIAIELIRSWGGMSKGWIDDVYFHGASINENRLKLDMAKVEQDMARFK